MTNRDTLLDSLRSDQTWEVVVIGGGATGLGTALDAATRGYRTLLLESRDFGHATSSRSTKLIHGGVRYLAQGNVGLVREALHERGLLLRNAPHLVHSKEFIVPAFHWWERPYYGLGLNIYDLMAGTYGIGRSRVLSRSAILGSLPTLKRDGLRGGISYRDGQFDDARLAIALLRSFQDSGGTALNYVAVTGLLKRNGKIAGVVAQDEENAEEWQIPARVVVNATGVFVDSVRALDSSESRPMVRPSQGAHLVLDQSFLPGSSALMIPKTDDGRVLFAIPWHDRVLLGTTDTPVANPAFEPVPLADEVDYLLTHIARYLDRPPVDSDVLSRFAGLRPLVDAGSTGRTSRLSREHAVVVSDSGLVTITGGKWTTYRRMAQDTVDRAVPVGDLRQRPCVTETLKLHGWLAETPRSTDWPHVYGSDLPELERLVSEHDDWGRPLHSKLPFRVGEVVWAARFESARTVEDVLARRLRALFLNARTSVESAPVVAKLLADELKHDTAWCENQIRTFTRIAADYLPAGSS
jgi:glycerol-3-phosphate dehydrogenase